MFIGFFAPGYTPYYRLNSEIEMLKIEHQKEMSDLKNFPKEISEALYKGKELTEKTNSYQ